MRCTRNYARTCACPPTEGSLLTLFVLLSLAPHESLRNNQRSREGKAPENVAEARLET